MFGLNFSNPTMLHGLWAAALPVLIHLLNRRRSVAIAFSNVALLQTLQQDRMRRVQIKQWLLVAIRTLLIVLLVMVFARPTIRETPFGNGHGETSAVMLIDQSMSMRYRKGGSTILAHAKHRAGQALSQFDERDVVTVIPYDERAYPSDPVTLDRLRFALADVEASFLGSDPVAAVDAARQVLRKSQTLNRELYVFSDLARAGWESLQDPYDGFEGTTVYVVRPPGHGGENVSVRSIRPAGLLLTVGKPAQINVELENFGAQRVSELPVYAFVDGQRIGQKIVAIGPGERVRATFRYTPERGGAREIRAEIPDDDLTADNKRSSIVHIPDRIRVGVIGEAKERYYVQEALGTDGTAGLEVASIEPGAGGAEDYASLDVMILCNVRRLGRGEVNSIRRRVSRGAGLFVLLGEGVDLRVYNEQVFPTLCPMSVTGVSGDRSGQRYTGFEPSGADHPVLGSLVKEDIRSPRFYVNYVARIEGESRSVLDFTAGSPALVENRLGQGRAMVLLSHTALEWSDLPVTGFFAPFLHRAVRYLATGSFGADDVIVGRKAVRPAKVIRAREAVIQPPKGPLRTVWAQQLGERAYWAVENVDLPGVWEISAGERIVDRFAAQTNSREGKLVPVADAVISRAFHGADVLFVGPDEDLARVVADHRHGSELWRVFLIAALVCLAIELSLMSGETRERT